MSHKITALLLATALPGMKVLAHSVNKPAGSVNGYLYMMLSIAAVYLLFLVLRMQRKKQ
jgi:hypothetical protein